MTHTPDTHHIVASGRVQRLFVIYHPTPLVHVGGWHSTGASGYTPPVEAVHAFSSEEDAWTFLIGGDPSTEVSMRRSWRVVEVAPKEREFAAGYDQAVDEIVTWLAKGSDGLNTATFGRMLAKRCREIWPRWPLDEGRNL